MKKFLSLLTSMVIGATALTGVVSPVNAITIGAPASYAGGNYTVAIEPIAAPGTTVPLPVGVDESALYPVGTNSIKITDAEAAAGITIPVGVYIYNDTKATEAIQVMVYASNPDVTLYAIQNDDQLPGGAFAAQTNAMASGLSESQVRDIGFLDRKAYTKHAVVMAFAAFGGLDNAKQARDPSTKGNNLRTKKNYYFATFDMVIPAGYKGGDFELNFEEYGIEPDGSEQAYFFEMNMVSTLDGLVPVDWIPLAVSVGDGGTQPQPTTPNLKFGDVTIDKATAQKATIDGATYYLAKMPLYVTNDPGFTGAVIALNNINANVIPANKGEYAEDAVDPSAFSAGAEKLSVAAFSSSPQSGNNAAGKDDNRTPLYPSWRIALGFDPATSGSAAQKVLVYVNFLVKDAAAGTSYNVGFYPSNNNAVNGVLKNDSEYYDTFTWGADAKITFGDSVAKDMPEIKFGDVSINKKTAEKFFIDGDTYYLAKLPITIKNDVGIKALSIAFKEFDPAIIIANDEYTDANGDDVVLSPVEGVAIPLANPYLHVPTFGKDENATTYKTWRLILPFLEDTEPGAALKTLVNVNVLVKDSPAGTRYPIGFYPQHGSGGSDGPNFVLQPTGPILADEIPAIWGADGIISFEDDEDVTPTTTTGSTTRTTTTTTRTSATTTTTTRTTATTTTTTTRTTVTTAKPVPQDSPVVNFGQVYIDLEDANTKIYTINGESYVVARVPLQASYDPGLSGGQLTLDTLDPNVTPADGEDDDGYVFKTFESGAEELMTPILFGPTLGKGDNRTDYPTWRLLFGLDDTTPGDDNKDLFYVNFLVKVDTTPGAADAAYPVHFYLSENKDVNVFILVEPYGTDADAEFYNTGLITIYGKAAGGVTAPTRTTPTTPTRTTRTTVTTTTATTTTTSTLSEEPGDTTTATTLLSTIITSASTTTIPAESVPTEEPYVGGALIWGDVDLNHEIGLNDAISLLKYVSLPVGAARENFARNIADAYNAKFDAGTLRDKVYVDADGNPMKLSARDVIKVANVNQFNDGTNYGLINAADPIQIISKVLDSRAKPFYFNIIDYYKDPANGCAHFVDPENPGH